MKDHYTVEEARFILAAVYHDIAPTTAQFDHAEWNRGDLVVVMDGEAVTITGPSGIHIDLRPDEVEQFTTELHTFINNN